MDKITALRHNIKLLHQKIKDENLGPFSKVLLIEKLQQVSYQYLIELAFDDNIEWQQYFDIIDILSDNINYLKQKI